MGQNVPICLRTTLHHIGLPQVAGIVQRQRKFGDVQGEGA